MNMRKVFKQMLATVAAGAMSMAMVMPVFAEDITTKQTEAWISKTYNTEVAKAETFSFTATQKKGDGLVSKDVSLTMPEISFTEADKGTTTQRKKVTFPNYQEAGKYEYTVIENETAQPAIPTDSVHEKMIMSKAEYTMDVYVENINDGCQIANIIVNKTKDDKGETATGKVDISNTDKNGFEFTNTYVQEAGTGENPSNPGEDYKNYGSLNVSKKIELNENGGTASATDSFSFKATFNFPAGTDASTLGGVKVNGSAITLTDGACDFKLKNGENKKFTGLPVGTTMTVTESATPNYKGSANVTINGADESTVAATKYNEAITVSNKKLGQKKNAVDVTNTYNNVPLTGIIMNNLPYIAMIVIGAAALVVYVQNKRKNLQ